MSVGVGASISILVRLGLCGLGCWEAEALLLLDIFGELAKGLPSVSIYMMRSGVGCRRLQTRPCASRAEVL